MLAVKKVMCARSSPDWTDKIAVCVGGDVLRGYITDRRQRLRKGDEDALTRYRATITDGKVHSGAPPSLGSYGLEEAMRLTPKTPAGADKGTLLPGPSGTA